jgi:hypothetical protein
MNTMLHYVQPEIQDQAARDAVRPGCADVVGQQGLSAQGSPVPVGLVVT